MKVVIWNRQTQKEETEKVYGDKWLNLLYGTRSGQWLAENLLTRPAFSKIYGIYQSSPLSRHKIKDFISEFQIPMDQFEEGPFGSFNEFFIRHFKSGMRPFVSDPQALPAFAEGRYFAFEKVDGERNFPVKGKSLSAELLLGSKEAAKPFIGGPSFVARLCPVDYHRFHYLDEGNTFKSYRLSGHLHSVNPLALLYKDDIFVSNERHVSLLQTKSFGKLAYVEVGALCVGRIVQSHPERQPFQRGMEKGYFLFGGSTIVVLGEPGAWRPDDDLLEQTTRGRETLIRLGEKIATTK